MRLVIVLAVANSLNIRMHITESHNNFKERTIIAVCLQGESGPICLAHVNEIRYVSTYVPDVSLIFRTTN